MIIKVFLILSVLAATAYLVRGGSTGRHLAIRRIAGMVFALGWVVAVIAPDLVTTVANAVGVGRGTDLVLYVLAVAFLFSTVTQRQHLRDLEDRIAVLTRELALATPQPPDPAPAQDSSPPEPGPHHDG